jgi:methionine synthase I (cobalamin-dependent)
MCWFLAPSLTAARSRLEKRAPSEAELTESAAELADLLKREGCDLILLEMMYDPAKVDAAFVAATATGLPVWAGFSARRGTGDALAILRQIFDGPLLAYPDSGFFRSPQWVFEEVIPPDDLKCFAEEWVTAGARIIGGCCGLTPMHIEALRELRD